MAVEPSAEVVPLPAERHLYEALAQGRTLIRYDRPGCGLSVRPASPDWSLDDENSPLRITFRKLGLDDAKELSLLLIDAFWRRYNNEAVPVQELVQEYLED